MQSSAQEYIRIREEAGKVCCQDSDYYYKIVDEKPYFPLLFADNNNEESIKEVTKIVINYNNQNSESCYTNDDSSSLMSIERVTGGLTNHLYKVGYKNVNYLIRLFGEVEGMIDRDVENNYYAILSKKGHAPSYYGRFGNGRIEGWLNDMRPMQFQEMKHYSHPIATKLALLHKDFPIDIDSSEKENIIDTTHSNISLWKQIHSWMDQAIKAIDDLKKKHNNHNEEEETLVSILINELDFKSIPLELMSLQEMIVQKKKKKKNCKIAFCHNDVWASNIMLSTTTTTTEDSTSSSGADIQLIDFEYGNYNYVAYDIANHFNEYAGGNESGNPNYKLFLTEEHQRNFLKQYLKIYNTSKEGNNDNVDDGDEKEKALINELYDDVQNFILINHIYWGLWGIMEHHHHQQQIQNQTTIVAKKEIDDEGIKGSVTTDGDNGNDDFNYLLYAKNRIARYRELTKKESI